MDMAEGDGGYSPELFSTPSVVSSPDVHPGMTTPTVPIVHPGVTTPTGAPIAHAGVTTPTDVHPGVTTPGGSSDSSPVRTTPTVPESTRKVLLSLTEFLTFASTTPKSSKQGKKTPGPARVLTSKQSLETLLEKEKKKKEEEEVKEKKVIKRECRERLGNV